MRCVQCGKEFPDKKLGKDRIKKFCNNLCCAKFYGKIRKEIIVKKGNLCERCKIKVIDELHHKRYAKLPLELQGKNKDRHEGKINFLMGIVEGLCEQCHEDIHSEHHLGLVEDQNKIQKSSVLL